MGVRACGGGRGEVGRIDFRGEGLRYGKNQAPVMKADTSMEPERAVWPYGLHR
jgi:hypothetical protein